jgi:hypothetical protein
MIWTALHHERLHARHDGLLIVHGDCPTGADAIADAWPAKPFAVAYERHVADWLHCRPTCHHPAQLKKGVNYCPAAGPYRNQEMVDAGAAVCLAFILPGSRGTIDCVKRARAAGIPTLEFGDDS